MCLSRVRGPFEYYKELEKYIVSSHIKDVADPGLAAALRGEETGIGMSAVPIGGSVNADNIRKVLNYMKKRDFSGDVSIECDASDRESRESGSVDQGCIGHLTLTESRTGILWDGSTERLGARQLRPTAAQWAALLWAGPLQMRKVASVSYPPNSYAASNMARMFSGGTLAWMLWTWLKT